MNILKCVDPITESNCYILSVGVHAIVIDPNDKDRVVLKLKELGLTPEFILLTHEHCDHMVGAGAVKAAFPGVKIVCSEECNAQMQSERTNMSAIMPVYLNFRGKPRIPYPRFKGEKADITFKDEYTFSWQGFDFYMRHCPGHTPGSSIIKLGNYLFSGDYLIQGEEVILRMPSGSEVDYNNLTLPYLKSLPKGTRVLPGHKGPFNT